MDEKGARELLDRIIHGDIKEVSPELEELLKRYPDVWEDYIVYRAFKKMDTRNLQFDWKNTLYSRKRKYKTTLLIVVGAIVGIVLLMYFFVPSVGHFYRCGMNPFKFYHWYMHGHGRHFVGFPFFFGRGIGRVIFYVRFIAPFAVVFLAVYAVYVLIKAVKL